MAIKKKFRQQSKAEKDKVAMKAKGEGAKAVAEAQALIKELEAKEAEGLKKMARSSLPSGLVSVERKRGGQPGTSNKATAQPAPVPQSQPGNDKLQSVLSYLLKDSGNLDFIYSLIKRLK